jgi:hypothetical protein
VLGNHRTIITTIAQRGSPEGTHVQINLDYRLKSPNQCVAISLPQEAESCTDGRGVGMNNKKKACTECRQQKV